MRKEILIVMLITLAGVFCILGLYQVEPVQAERLDTTQPTALQANSTAVGDGTGDSALAATTSSWAALDSWVNIPERFNQLKVMFYCYGDGVGAGSPDGGTFSYTIYVGENYGTAQIVASGTATCGAQQMSHDPVTASQLNSGAVSVNYCWVDTLGAVTEDWAGDVITSNDGGANSAAAIYFDRYSAKKIWIRVHTITSVTTVYSVVYGF